MKKMILILAVLMISSGFLWADGFGLTSNLTLDTDDNGGVADVTNLSIYLRPFYTAMLDDTIEVAPFVSFYMAPDYLNGTVTDEYYSISAGTGVYFHFINERFVSLSAGADIGAYVGWDPDIDPFISIGGYISLPVVFDLKFSESFMLRVMQEVASLSFNYMNNNNTNTTSTAIDTLFSGLNPTFGFVILF